MDEIELKSKVLFYLREKCYHAMQNVALDGLMKFQSNLSLKLLNAIAMLMCNRIQDCVREFESLQSEDELILCATLALIYAHKKQSTVEKDVLQKLDNQLKDIRRSSGPDEFYYASLFLFACEKWDKAADYIDKCLKLNSEHVDGIVLKGWVELYRGKNNMNILSTEVLNYFTTVLNKNKRHIDAAFGEIEYYESVKKFDESLNGANKAIVRFPNMIEPLVKKMKIQFAMQDWEQTIETMNRIINIDSINLNALKMNVLLLLCRDGNYDEATECMSSFYRVLEKAEPKNAVIFHENAELFSRICGRNKSILSETFKFAEKAVHLDSSNAEFISELGYQSLLQGKVKEALRYYKSAAKVNDSSIGALIGMTLCELTENGITDQIHHQMEFILEMSAAEVSPILLFMQAKISTDSPDKAIKYLNEAIDSHLKPLQSYPYGDIYLKLLDPDFLLNITREYLKFSPKQPDTIGKGQLVLVQPNSVVKKSLNILKMLTKACPGLQDGLYMLAKVQYLIGDAASAMNTLNHILKNVDTNSADAHLLMAQIYIQQGLYQRASQSLEMGLSNNFKVRENPLYHFISGLVQKHEENIDETIKSFTTALSLVDVTVKDTSYGKEKNFNSELTRADKASLYMELVNAYSLSGQSHEAAKILQNAMEEFKGSPEEARIVIMNAEQALQKKDVKTAIDMLNKLKPEEPYYIEAHTKLAEVYLKYRRDRSAFMQCFREVVEHCPGPESYLLFGDACMSIQEPERAIDAYERALNCNPKDPMLASKMGNALVKTHQYNKAVSYYKDAIKLTQNSELKIDLANLYVKLKQFDKAEVVIQDELDCNKKSGDDDFLTLVSRTKCFLLLSKIQEKSGNVKGALATLKEARDCQNRLEKRVSLEQPGSVGDQVRTSVEICTRMAELSVSLRDNEKATHFYKEALALNPSNTDTLVALAKLYLQMNYLELCQQTCSVLLKTDPENESASVMMADLAFRKIDFDTAAFHFKQILNKQPTYWTAMARLIEVMRRTGGLAEVPAYLRKAEEVCEKPKDPGLAYCVGLHEWYSGNPNAALRHFNNARQDSEWGQQAIYNMIEICLNPEDEMVGGDAFDSIEDVEYRDSRSMALQTAERLLKELKPRPGGIDDEALRHRLLGNFLLLATKQKPSIEEALDDFTNLASQDAFKEHIGPILGVASAHILLKQGQRARNQLKRVAKSLWTFEDAEYLERCWLLLADLYIQSTKYDLAMDLLRRVLQHNRTCTKAYEFCGYIAEKEQHYKEAAGYYDSAWKYGGKGNPAVGYKLAFCHMKCKKFADAIDVCNQVLKAHPDYPKIKKDILDKSLNNLRT